MTAADATPAERGPGFHFRALFLDTEVHVTCVPELLRCLRETFTRLTGGSADSAEGDGA
jgi:hypothetical protein